MKDRELIIEHRKLLRILLIGHKKKKTQISYNDCGKKLRIPSKIAQKIVNFISQLQKDTITNFDKLSCKRWVNFVNRSQKEFRQRIAGKKLLFFMIDSKKKSQIS